MINKKEITQILQEDHCYKVNHLSLTIDYCDYEQSPREFNDNLGRMVCFHNVYNLGDKHDFPTHEEFEKFFKIQDQDILQYSNYTSVLRNQIPLIKAKEGYIILPLYLYDHSGITMSVTPFHCRWDSGQVGYIYAKKDKNLSNQEIKEILINEVEIYDQYIRGEVYQYSINHDDEFLDGVSGYYSRQDCISDSIDSFKHYYLGQHHKPKQLELF
jgi:hypothetical protein